MALNEEEVVDAESGTLNKNSNPVDHLKHLLSLGWDKTTPLIQKFVEKYSLDAELKEILQSQKK